MRDPSRATARQVNVSRVALLAAAVMAIATATAGWRAQGGGTATWPNATWTHRLGSGTPGIVVDQDRLYTAYRQPRFTYLETVVCLDISTGTTQWEFSSRSPLLDSVAASGPNSTPLVAGDGVYHRGTHELFALERKSGHRRWSHDLIGEYGVTPRQSGDWAPVAYGNSIIVVLGGPGQEIAAFAADSGDMVWKTGDFGTIVTAPHLATLGSHPQIVFLTERGGIVGIDPERGRALWGYGMAGVLPSDRGELVVAGSTVLVSSRASGTLALEVRQTGSGTAIRQKWRNAGVAVATGALVDDVVVGTTSEGDLTVISAQTGRAIWKEFNVQPVLVSIDDGRLLFLERDATVAAARVSRAGLHVEQRGTLSVDPARSRMATAGHHLYVRDDRSILAFDP